MERTCAWCKGDLGASMDRQGPEEYISHGICDACLRSVNTRPGMDLGSYLNTLDAPVLAVDSDGVVKIANEKAYRLTSKQPRDVLEQRGGDVFECSYARLPGGCGRTVHCSGCTIRIAVNETYRTGLPRMRVPAFLCQGPPGAELEVCMYVSTEKIGDLVMLRIDRVGSGRFPAGP